MSERLPKPFRIEEKPIGDNKQAVVLALHGFLDAYTVQDFEKRTGDLVAAGYVGFIVDIDGLDFISSAGFGSLMSLTKAVRKKNGDLILFHPPERILSILELMGLSKVHRFASNEDEALEMLEEKS